MESPMTKVTFFLAKAEFRTKNGVGKKMMVSVSALKFAKKADVSKE